MLILVVGILVATWITKLIGGKLGQKAHDPLMSSFLARAIKIVLAVLLFLLAMHVAGLSGIAGALMATFGASAVVLGFAFKDIAENFLAGIILAFNRPFKVNDTVKIEDLFGKEKEMEFRYTKITTFDGRNVYIPKGNVLRKPVYNYTEDGFFRTDFIVGIAYENDIEKARELILQCLNSSEGVVNEGQHVSFSIVDELATSTVNIKVHFWVHTDNFRRGMLETRSRLIKNVKTTLESNGFNLPAEIRELKFYNASDPIEVNLMQIAVQQMPQQNGITKK
jgi:small conductance mechanosensitive channel